MVPSVCVPSICVCVFYKMAIYIHTTFLFILNKYAAVRNCYSCEYFLYNFWQSKMLRVVLSVLVSGLLSSRCLAYQTTVGTCELNAPYLNNDVSTTSNFNTVRTSFLSPFFDYID